jgi:hypothetical protein
MPEHQLKQGAQNAGSDGGGNRKGEGEMPSRTDTGGETTRTASLAEGEMPSVASEDNSK